MERCALSEHLDMMIGGAIAIAGSVAMIVFRRPFSRFMGESARMQWGEEFVPSDPAVRGLTIVVAVGGILIGVSLLVRAFTGG